MREYFEIDGYWKDNRETFQGLIATNFDDFPRETEPYTDDDIFYYGLDVNDLENCIDLGEDTIDDFVITGYTKITV